MLYTNSDAASSNQKFTALIKNRIACQIDSE